jgi:ribosomal protein S12 methylthiotransferase accessory factor YcaO
MIKKFEFIEQIGAVNLPNDCPISVFAAVLKPDPWGRKRVVSGRGTSSNEALRKCLAEATERWCAVFDPTRGGIWGTEKEVAPAAISPESLLLISDQQYERADSWNRDKDPDHHLPKRRDPDRPLLWVEAESLTRSDKVLVPAACCFLGYPLAKDHGFTVPDSSGLAAGYDPESCTDCIHLVVWPH